MKQFNFPSIQPNEKDTCRPFWSVMIPTYNGTDYLTKTLESVLEQDPGLEQMQIEVIDDCSTKDNPEQLVKEIGQRRISFVQQSENLGQIKTWNNCIQRAYGHWIHILHQDDVVLPGFYNRLRKLIEQEQQIGAAFCRNIYMDEDGHWLNISELERKEPGILENWLELIATKQRIQFPAIVVKRSTYEELGGFCPDAYSASDWEMWKRIAANYLVGYEPQVLACFRLHSASESSRLIKYGANIAHTLQAIEISKSYLPDSDSEKWSRQAREYYAMYALNTASTMFSINEKMAAFNQIKEAFRCSYSLPVIMSLIKVFLKANAQLIMKLKNK
jgi:glycosyltransferase involved in cell wall biosynthesis